jgi:hypothetical protein
MMIANMPPLVESEIPVITWARKADNFRHFCFSRALKLKPRIATKKRCFHGCN